MDEGSTHFDQTNYVHRTLRRITARLHELTIPHAVVGAMAMFFHGYRRFTEDVDLLVSRTGFDQINRELEALGLVRLIHGGRHPRDAETGVRVRLLVAGDYPGDGKSKPIIFPDPAAVAVELNGVRCVNLPALVELKLASGLCTPNRLRDLGDVQELIRAIKPPRELADQLNPYVRDKYLELWDVLKQAGELD